MDEVRGKSKKDNYKSLIIFFVFKINSLKLQKILSEFLFIKFLFILLFLIFWFKFVFLLLIFSDPLDSTEKENDKLIIQTLIFSNQ